MRSGKKVTRFAQWLPEFRKDKTKRNEGLDPESRENKPSDQRKHLPIAFQCQAGLHMGEMGKTAPSILLILLLKIFVKMGHEEPMWRD